MCPPYRRLPNMNINKYTEKAREAVAASIELAREHNNPQLEPEHLLVALVEQREGIIPDLVRKMNADPAHLGRAARELLARIPSAYGGSEPSLSPRLNAVRGCSNELGHDAARPRTAERHTHDRADVDAVVDLVGELARDGARRDERVDGRERH